MKVIFLTVGNQLNASSRTRVFQFLPYYKKLNIKGTVFIRNPYFFIPPTNFLVRAFQRVHIFFIEISFFISALFFKNIYLQKVCLPQYMIYCFAGLKKRIFYDFIDSVYINEKNGNIKKKKLNRLNYILKKSYLIIVENEQNRNYAAQFNSEVITVTGPIECARYKPLKKIADSDQITIGWIGSSSTTSYLNIIKEPIYYISKKYPKVKLLLIGSSKIEIPGVDVIFEPWTIDGELELLSKIDIGIMPLFFDEWSKGKGGYKLLQYMALGLPSIATPCGVNKEIIIHGKSGYLASDKQEWIKYLEELIIDNQKRVNFGMEARKRAVEKYSYEYYSPMLAKYLHKN